ncbi:MAG: 4Fe-4S dicluster domain-containing protein [Candidatus Omnitrophota bacterium]|nr:MAG: 4Fe-4S dicluster domain-containing protein [Candidatus Omnitrophota bacterium]
MEISVKKVHSDLVKKISQISGQNIGACYQCGKCSAGCPSAERMDNIPSQFIKLIQLGAESEIKRSNTPWICLTCFICTVRCPKGIDIAGIMEAARLLEARSNVDYFEVRSLAQALLEENLPPIAVVSCFRKHTSI